MSLTPRILAVQCNDGHRYEVAIKKLLPHYVEDGHFVTMLTDEYRLVSRMQLAEQRTAEGYMAEVVRDASGDLTLIEHHCPICDAAKRCVGICAAELAVFRRSLGDEVEVERTRHLLTDSDRCAYRIRPADD